MASIEEIVDVTITANTLGVTQAGFGVMLILGTTKAFTDRIRYYNNLAGVGQDFSPTDPEYQAAVLAFSQLIKPERIAIGRVLTSTSMTVTVSDAVNNFNYTIYINGLPLTYRTDTGATLVSIAAGLADALNNAVPQVVDAVPDGSGSLTIVPHTPSLDYGIRVGNKLTITDSIPTQTWVQALTDIQAVSDDWYGLVALTRTNFAQILTFSADFQADSVIDLDVNGDSISPVSWNTNQLTTMNNLVAAIKAIDSVRDATIVAGSSNHSILVTSKNNYPMIIDEIEIAGATPPTPTVTNAEDPAIDIASWISAQKKLYLTSSSDITTLDNPSTSLAAQFKASGYRRTAVLYNELADFSYPEAAWLGRMLPTDPGAANWKFKNLVGIKESVLTATQSLNARTVNNANTYERIGGIAITREGIVSSGEYLDIVVGIDWLEARIEERIYQRMTALDKIPFTDEGIAIIQSELIAQLDQAVSVGLIQDDYQVDVPKAAEVSLANKAARLLPDVFFSATLAGAINAVKIQGTVSV